MAAGEMDPGQLMASLEKANHTSELFQQKNAELEKVNDQLRMDNVRLTQTVNELTKEINSLNATLSAKESPKKDRSPKANGSHSPKEKKSKNHLTPTDHSQEVKTLRRVKEELEQQLNDSKYSTLSFHASFQAEFDLRTQIEQKLDELRDRYERLVMENDQLRQILHAHNISAPSPPGLRSLPGSRKKKHSLKARPMTMYSDLSGFTAISSAPPTDSKNKKPSTQSQLKKIKKASSLQSLEETSSPEPMPDLKSRELSNETPANTAPSEAGSTVMAETAQRIVEDTHTHSHEVGVSPSHKGSVSLGQSGPSEATDSQQVTNEVLASDHDKLNGVTEADQPPEENGTEESSPRKAYPADTLVWTAKGFLDRMEKFSDESKGGDKEGEEKRPGSNERDENELAEMLSSVSVKQLESAKAFLEASLQKSSVDED